MENEKRILVVDDERNMRTTLAAILEEEGYSVDLAATGEDALGLCSNNLYDCVLMDIRMPGLGGLEAFRLIREQQEGARVILMSAYSGDVVIRQALQGGAVAFLTKPLDIPDLLKKLRGIDD